MVATALVLDLVFLAAAFGLRTALQRRRTGDSGWRIGRPRSAGDGAARVLLVGSAALLVAAVADPPPADRFAALRAPGIVVAVASIVVVLVAQLQMGSSWRIGVDADEQTELVTHGLYRYARNPIYTGMVGFAAGQVLLLPGPWTVAALAAMAVGVELQVRAVEEPYLRRSHGGAYRAWEASAGRFVPLLGRRRAAIRPYAPVP